jgi:hypothetical protein
LLGKKTDKNLFKEILRKVKKHTKRISENQTNLENKGSKKSERAFLYQKPKKNSEKIPDNKGSRKSGARLFVPKTPKLYFRAVQQTRPRERNLFPFGRLPCDQIISGACGGFQIWLRALP